jgi:prepilin-type N-terminal cleavage/methylation domain-containing protein
MKTAQTIHTSRKAGRPAFTLIELLTVISIALILVMLAVPAMNNLRRSSGVDAAARVVANHLSLARQYAITHRTPTRWITPDVHNSDAKHTWNGRVYAVIARDPRFDASGIQHWTWCTDYRRMPSGTVLLYWNSPVPGSVTTLPKQTVSLYDSHSTNNNLFISTNSLSGEVTTNVVYFGNNSFGLPVRYIEFDPRGLPTQSHTIMVARAKAYTKQGNYTPTQATERAYVIVDGFKGDISVETKP